MVKFLDKLSDLAKAALGQKSGASYDARVVAESQKRYESLLRDVERIFPASGTAPPSASKAAVDDSEFEDIPAELRALDDEMTAGDLEFDEFRRRHGPARVADLRREALTPDRPKRPKAATVPRSPLFRAVGARVSFWVSGVDGGHACLPRGRACHAIDSTDADARVAAVVDNIRVAMRGAATARRPVPRRKIKERPWAPGAKRAAACATPLQAFRRPQAAAANHPSDYAKPRPRRSLPKRPSSEPPKPPPKPPTCSIRAEIRRAPERASGFVRRWPGTSRVVDSVG
ncbi:hypothetical protein JL722_11966 [Aureococcus anophagefferens]|nr:hypothetical protein JL722_11966 [Aureococcus anophagefferens]